MDPTRSLFVRRQSIVRRATRRVPDPACIPPVQTHGTNKFAGRSQSPDMSPLICYSGAIDGRLRTDTLSLIPTRASLRPTWPGGRPSQSHAATLDYPHAANAIVDPYVNPVGRPSTTHNDGDDRQPADQEPGQISPAHDPKPTGCRQERQRHRQEQDGRSGAGKPRHRQRECKQRSEARPPRLTAAAIIASIEPQTDQKTREAAEIDTAVQPSPVLTDLR